MRPNGLRPVNPAMFTEDPFADRRANGISLRFRLLTSSTGHTHRIIDPLAMKKIYISATFKDLEEHRAAVALALRKMGYLVRCMEEYTATESSCSRGTVPGSSPCT